MKAVAISMQEQNTFDTVTAYFILAIKYDAAANFYFYKQI